MANILVVDHDPDIRKAVRGILETEDHTIVTASDGKSALEESAGGAPDLVISNDYGPEMDDVEFLIRNQAVFPGVRIVAISAGGFRDKENVLGTAVALGTVGTLERPFTVEEVLDLVGNALEKEDAGGS